MVVYELQLATGICKPVFIGISKIDSRTSASISKKSGNSGERRAYTRLFIIIHYCIPTYSSPTRISCREQESTMNLT